MPHQKLNTCFTDFSIQMHFTLICFPVKHCSDGVGKLGGL